MKTILPLLFLLLFGASLATAQVTIEGDLDLEDSTQVHLIVTKSGDRFIGRILSIENTKVQFLFNERVPMQFDMKDLRTIKVRSQDKPDDNYVYREETREYVPKIEEVRGINRILYSNPAFSLKQGEWEYSNTMLFLNRLETGLTDHLSVGVTVLPLIFFNGISGHAKLTADLNEQIHIGLNWNVMAIDVPFNEAYGINDVSGSLTIGSPDFFVNASGGYGFPILDTNQGSMIYSLSGSFRTGNRWRVFGEGIFFSFEGRLFLATFGASWFNQKNKLDFGLTGIVFDTFPVVGPYVSYSRYWGK